MKIITYIAVSLLAVSAASVRAGSAQENWNKDCAQCHGKTGAADTKMGQKLNAKDLTDPKVQASLHRRRSRQGHQGRDQGEW